MDTTGDEHVRFARYQKLLTAHHVDEFVVLAAALNDPDRVMGQSVVTWHLERQVPGRWARQDFLAWLDRIARLVAGYPFLVSRVQEWSLVSAIALGSPWSPDDLLAASDWAQGKVVAVVASAEALTLLAESGRTRRVRNGAAARGTAGR